MATNLYDEENPDMIESSIGPIDEVGFDDLHGLQDLDIEAQYQDDDDGYYQDDDDDDDYLDDDYQDNADSLGWESAWY